jgi:homocysteine S-methyltransferase
MNPIEHIIKEYSLMILDGAFATELERKGCDINDELWSAKILMEQPELIGEVHKDYYEAGADCGITASYQATVEGFLKKGFTREEAVDALISSVTIAKDVRDTFWNKEKNRLNRPKPLVAASVGPYGAFLADGSEYRGNYAITETDLEEFHRDRLHILSSAKPDVLACETIPCGMEARVLARLIEEQNTLYGWISFTAKDGKHISSGEAIADIVKELDSYSHIAAIGINCTAPEYVEELIETIEASTTKPVIVYPNYGEHYDAETKSWHGSATHASFGESSHQWYQKGARIIGGCCRTSPDDIRQITAWARRSI